MGFQPHQQALIIDFSKSTTDLYPKSSVTSRHSYFQEVLDEVKYYKTADILYFQSSGTSGKPKKLPFNKKQIQASVHRTLDFFQINKGESVLLCLPLDYVAGKMMLYRAIEGGLKLIALPPDQQPLANLQEDAALAAVVPNQLNKLHQADNQKYLKRIRHVLIGGSSIPAPLETWLQASTTNIWHSYGMTETLTHIAMRRISPDRQDGFYPMQGVNVFVNHQACLVIEDRKLQMDRLETNDLAEIKPDGSFRILGRADGAIISGGVKIHPEILERKINHLIDRNFMISSLPDCHLGEVVVLVLEGELSISQLYDLWQKLELQLNRIELPKRIETLESFTYNKNGKLERKKIHEKILYILSNEKK